MLIVSPLSKYCNGSLKEQYKFLRDYLHADQFMINRCDFISSANRPQWGPENNRWIQWVNCRIILQLDNLDYRGVGTLLRVATGMLNKLDIPSEHKQRVHEEMTRNIWKEHGEIQVCDLPF